MFRPARLKTPPASKKPIPIPDNVRHQHQFVEAAEIPDPKNRSDAVAGSLQRQLVELPGVRAHHLWKSARFHGLSFAAPDSARGVARVGSRGPQHDEG